MLFKVMSKKYLEGKQANDHTANKGETDAVSGRDETSDFKLSYRVIVLGSYSGIIFRPRPFDNCNTACFICAIGIFVLSQFRFYDLLWCLG
jgi:hypothetical protein